MCTLEFAVGVNIGVVVSWSGLWSFLVGVRIGVVVS